MIITFEGGDQAGKKTQSAMLQRKLRSAKLKTRLFSFPDYTTPIGKEIDRYLHGKRKYPAQVIHCLLAANRWERASDLQDAKEKNSVIIMNRYRESNLVYGITNGLKLAWLEKLDEGLPKSDLVIVLDVPQKESFARKKQNRDKFEKNKQFSNLPNLNAYYQQSYTAYRNEFNFYDADKQWFLQSSWGLQLNIPVFSGGQRHALTQQAKIRLMKDQNSLMQMEQTLKMQETQAKNNLLNAQSKLELQKQNVVLARKIYQNATASEQIGEGTSIVVTQKYNQLIVAQTQYVGATIDLFQAQLELDKIFNTILKN